VEERTVILTLVALNETNICEFCCQNFQNVRNNNSI